MDKLCKSNNLNSIELCMHTILAIFGSWKKENL